MYEMKPEYYTGIGFIDKEHTRLFEIAQETSSLLQDDLLQDKTEEIIRVVSELIDYTRSHFAHEEEYQKIIKYPNREEHIAQHRKFEESLMQIDLEAMEHDLDEQNEAVEKLLDFLVNWLINHIQKADMLFAKK